MNDDGAAFMDSVGVGDFSEMVDQLSGGETHCKLEPEDLG
jgi:hypothetical protein